MSLVRRLADTLTLVRGALRAERASSVMLFILVLVTATLAASIPMLAGRAAHDSLQYALEQASVVERNLVFARQTHKLIDVVETDHGIVPAEGDPFTAVERAGAELAADLPPAVAAAVEDVQFVAQTARYLARRPPQPVTHLHLRYQSDIERHIRYVEGRPPTGEVILVECPPVGECEIGDEPPITYEMALSRDTAQALRLGLGGRLLLDLEVASPRPRPGIPPTPGDVRQIGVVVTGIFEVLAPDDDYWLRDTSLERPTIQPVTLDLSNYFATALVAREAYTELPGLIQYIYAWRFRLDPARVDAAALATFERDLRRLEAHYPTRPLAATGESPSLTTGLSRVLATYRAQRGSSEAALTVIGAGPLVAVGGSVVLMALLWVQRRNGALLYLRQRGASSAQVLLRATIEALLIAVPAALAGFLLATVLVAGRDLAAAASAAAAIAGLAVATVALAAAPTARASLRTSAPVDSAASGARMRRLVFEMLVIGLAAGGAVLLSERGAAAGGGGIDPFLAVVPALIGIAAGLALLRVYPLPIRALSRLAGLSRRLVPAHALRTSARESGLARLPLLVLLLAAALAVFTSGVLVTLERGQLASSWQQLGADYRVTARIGDVLPAELRLDGVPGIVATTRSMVIEAAVSGERLRREGVTLQAIEPDEFQALLAGTPAAVQLPGSFDGPWPAAQRGSVPGLALGNPDAPLPTVVSAGLAATAGLALGDQFDITIPGGRVVARVDEVRQTLPGLREAADFVVVPYPALRVAYPDRTLPPTLLLARGEALAEAVVRQQIEPLTRRLAPLANRHALYAQIHDAPLSRAISGGLQLALVATLAYGAIGLAGSSMLWLVSRRRELALLRILGARRRQLVALLLLGQLPAVVAALAVGVLLGLGLGLLLLPALGLQSFTGPGVAIVLQLEPLHVVLAVVAPAALALGLTLAGGWAVGRAGLAAIIRGGEAQAIERR